MEPKTIVSLSFDDGREDVYRNAYRIMKKYNLTGTLHATTGYVDGTWENMQWRTARAPVTIDQIKEISKYGFEISSHGDRHITEKNDLNMSIHKLQEWGVINKRVGFSIPCSCLSEPDRTSFVDYLRTSDVAYMRGGRNPECYSYKSKIFYVCYNITKMQPFYYLFNRWNCIDIGNRKLNPYDLPSIVIRRGDRAGVITKFIKRNKGRWIILMFHGIQNRTEDTYGKDVWCWDAYEFEKLCADLNAMAAGGELSVEPIRDVIDKFQ